MKGREDIVKLTEEESSSIKEYSEDKVMTPIPLKRAFIKIRIWNPDGSYNDGEIVPLYEKENKKLLKKYGKNLVFLMCNSTDNSGIVKIIEKTEGLTINPDNKTWSYKGHENIPYGQKIEIGNETFGVYYGKRHRKRILKDLIKRTEMRTK